MRILLGVSVAAALVVASMFGLAAPASADENAPTDLMLCYEVDATGTVEAHPDPLCLPIVAACDTTTTGLAPYELVTVKVCHPI